MYTHDDFSSDPHHPWKKPVEVVPVSNRSAGTLKKRILGTPWLAMSVKIVSARFNETTVLKLKVKRQLGKT